MKKSNADAPISNALFYIIILTCMTVVSSQSKPFNISLKAQNFLEATLKNSKSSILALGNLFQTKDYTNLFLNEKDAFRLNTPQLIEAVGYKVETHRVTTKDGYILTIFRIRNPLRMPCQDSSKPPIFFQHGVVDSSRAWLVQDGDTGIPYVGVRSGYDVWLGKQLFLGTHPLFSQKSKVLEIQAVFDYILKATKDTNTRQQINYVGHSMGTTMFYVCLSRFPEYSKKIANFIALPPSSYLSSTTSPLRYLRPYIKLYSDVLIDGPFLWSEVNHLIQGVGSKLCDITIPVFSRDEVCVALTALLQGEGDVPRKILRRVLGGFPESTSKKTIAHFLQLVGATFFTQFDYGLLGNYRHYNNSVPPKYTLLNTAMRVLNIYGQQDLLIDYKDSETSNADLGTLKFKRNTLVYDYSHVDFIWGRKAAPLLSYAVFKFLESEKEPFNTCSNKPT